MTAISIKEIGEEEFGKFLAYLKVHLSENGDNDFYFLPLTKEQSQFNVEWESKFKSGMKKDFGEAGWRKLWISLNEENEIVGHIDIRSRNELNTDHRVLLGMGTDYRYRNQKIGQRLLMHVIEYCKLHQQISWIDLEVLGANHKAISMYNKMGFQLLSHTKDMFRFQNQSFDYRSMTLDVGVK